MVVHVTLDKCFQAMFIEVYNIKLAESVFKS